ncbi:uncharacterized protein LOC112905865 isoform X2 [Agrilus planipennis]|uniref:Uncharacterized protein LOC112905865 isoform X2 n=1 Tax=Agrilus planipennis TaxID=224129 RepID=A0A7F5RFZ7_AGRPL|nr:uncharacterized protein LOC112905865 isoform X2 [Agrilus planipennis]
MSPSSDVSNKGWICKLCCSKFRRSSKVKQMNKGKAKNDPNILFQSTISSKSKAQKAKTFSLFCPKYYNCVDVRNTYGGSALEGGTSIDKKLCGSLGWFLFPNKSQIQNEVQSKRTSPITNNTCDTVISKNTSEIHQNWETHKNPFGIECREGSLISKGPNDLPVSVREQFNDDRVMKCGFPCKFSPETTKISFPQHTIPAKDACLSNFSTNCGLNSLPAAREIVGDPKRQINGFHPFNRSPTLKQGLNNTNMRGTTKLYDYQELDMNNCMNGDANINGDKQIKNEYGENGTNPDTKVGDIVFKERVPEDLKNKDIFNYPADDTCEFSQVFENDGSAFGRFALFSRLCDKYKTINRRFTLKRTMKKKRKRRKDKSKLKWLARYIDEQLKKKGIIESSISEDLEKSIKIFFIRRFDSEKSSDEIIENNIYNRTSPQKRYVKCSSCGRDTSQSRCWNFTLKTSSFSNTISESKNITSKSDTSEKNINKRTIIEQNNNKRFVDVAVNYELLVSPKADKAVTALISNKTLKIDQYVDTHDIDQYYTNQKYNSRNCNNNIRSKRMCYKKIDFKDVVECFDENKRIVKLKKEQNRLIKNKTHCCLKKTSVTDLTQHRTKRSLLLSKSIPSFFKCTTKDKHNMKPGKNYDCQVLFRNKCHSSDASSHSPSSDDEHNVLFINKLSRSSFYIFITKAVNEDSNIRRSSSEISIRKKCVLNKRILVKSNSYCSRHIYRKENCGTYENYLVAFNYEEDKCSLLKKENNKCKTRDSFNEKHASGSSCLEGCEGGYRT